MLSKVISFFDLGSKVVTNSLVYILGKNFEINAIKKIRILPFLLRPKILLGNLVFIFKSSWITPIDDVVLGKDFEIENIEETESLIFLSSSKLVLSHLIFYFYLISEAIIDSSLSVLSKNFKINAIREVESLSFLLY